MRIRVSLEGTQRGERGVRLSADELFDLDLSREKTRWTIAGARAVDTPRILRGRPHLREVASEIGLSAALNDSVDPAEATNLCIPATHHHPGVVLADFDGDGSINVVLPGAHPRLFLNDGHGHFRDATPGSGR